MTVNLSPSKVRSSVYHCGSQVSQAPAVTAYYDYTNSHFQTHIHTQPRPPIFFPECCWHILRLPWVWRFKPDRWMYGCLRQQAKGWTGGWLLCSKSLIFQPLKWFPRGPKIILDWQNWDVVGLVVAQSGWCEKVTFQLKHFQCKQRSTLMLLDLSSKIESLSRHDAGYIIFCKNEHFSKLGWIGGEIKRIEKVSTKG